MNRLLLLVISLLLVIAHFTILSYPYFFFKINNYDSLGPLSVIDEKLIDTKKISTSDQLAHKFENQLLKGEKIAAKLTASENNFGIFLFRFAHLQAVVTDVVVFRIKKEGDSGWWYEHTYTADQFQPDQYFTFGFPAFKNSKNNTYIVEIESLSGTYENGTGLSMTVPQSALVYRFSRSDLKDTNNLFGFISKKFIYMYRNIDFLQNWQILVVLISIPLSFFFPVNIKIFVNFTKKDFNNLSIVRWFTSTRFYLLVLKSVQLL